MQDGAVRIDKKEIQNVRKVMFVIRKSKFEDIPEMMKTFAVAVQTMRNNGNLEQWINYPPDGLLESDIRAGKSYVIEAGGKLCGTFFFALEEDPTYLVIDDGAWLNDAPYGVIHRIASNGTERGVLKAAIDYCAQFSTNLRIDTHRDNTIMQHLLEKYGFQKCGIIYVQDAVSDHSPRLAYHRVAE